MKVHIRIHVLLGTRFDKKFEKHKHYGTLCSLGMLHDDNLEDCDGYSLMNNIVSTNATQQQISCCSQNLLYITLK